MSSAVINCNEHDSFEALELCNPDPVSTLLQNLAKYHRFSFLTLMLQRLEASSKRYHKQLEMQGSAREVSERHELKASQSYQRGSVRVLGHGRVRSP